MDLVTVVITTCKREAVIVQRAIESVKNQTYKNIEIIVVDDSPVDYSEREKVEKLVTGYGDIQYIKHSVNRGACAARNTGLENAEGSYIAFLDDDDEWESTKIEKQLSGFKDPSIGLVYCGRLYVDENNHSVRTPTYKAYTGEVYKEIMLNNFIGSTSFPLIRTHVLREIGGFDLKMESAQDYDVWIRIAEKYKVEYIDEPLVLYHIHNSEQISKNPEKVFSGLERLLEKNMPYLSTHRDALSIRYLKLALTYTQLGDRKKGFMTWKKGVQVSHKTVRYHITYLLRMLKIIE